ncbi:MAG: hypothetical protein E4G99_03165 [Anaerolineales bacterium]|nr:MAG: hypothetical protein E4G99_03165 [Anaerolineales bacterium]
MFSLKIHWVHTSLILGIAGVAITSCSLFNPVVRPGDVLFQDDFSRSDSGWDRYSDDVYSAEYVDNGYQIQVQATNMLVWSLPHVDFDNVLIRVEGLRIAGPINNVYGVLCRYLDAENFYFFLMSSDGYAGIGRYTAGKKELLNHETLLPTDAISVLDETNAVQAACVDHSLTLWVNGQVVAEATTPDLSHGDVGLIVGTYEQGGVEIQFDNFSTLMP